MSGSSRNRVASGQRVTHRRRCPICGHDSHCFFTDDGRSVWCMRVSEGAEKRDIRFYDGRLGSLHRLNGQAAAAPVKRDEAAMPTLSPAELANYARRFETAVPPSRLQALAAKLVVTVDSLRALRIGWADRDTLTAAGTKCTGEGCWSFPMTDGIDRVVGIRLRTPDGFKYAVTGGSSGVFVPAAEKADDVVVPEGPTDAAALIDLAFTPIGRADCQSGTPAIVTAVKRLQAKRVVLMLDNDPAANPQARRAVQLGMSHTRAALSQICRVVVIHPPDHKDVRAAVADGVSRRDVLRWIRAAEGDRRERSAEQSSTRRRSA